MNCEELHGAAERLNIRLCDIETLLNHHVDLVESGDQSAIGTARILSRELASALEESTTLLSNLETPA